MNGTTVMEGVGSVLQHGVCQDQMWSPDTSSRHKFPVRERTGLFFKILEVGVDIRGKWRSRGKSCLTISETREAGGERRTWGELDGV